MTVLSRPLFRRRRPVRHAAGAADAPHTYMRFCRLSPVAAKVGKWPPMCRPSSPPTGCRSSTWRPSAPTRPLPESSVGGSADRCSVGRRRWHGDAGLLRRGVGQAARVPRDRWEELRPFLHVDAGARELRSVASEPGQSPRGGCPALLPPEHSVSAIARMVGVSRGTLYAYMDRQHRGSKLIRRWARFVMPVMVEVECDDDEVLRVARRS
jgi:hypothetical protein